MSAMSLLTSALFLLVAHRVSCSERGCDELNLTAASESFASNGFAVLRGFADRDEVAAMRSSMEEMVDAWWREIQAAPENGPRAVFTTGSNQSEAQAKSRYFFESADRVHFFQEADSEGLEPAAEGGRERPPPLNKVGHGLHLDPASPFGRYSRSERVAAVARVVARLKAPVLPQSMYIFKSAHVGGSVTSHQDGTFLYTRPQQSVVGLWLALDAADEVNGCLWARPRSHHEPLRRRFVRSEGADGTLDHLSLPNLSPHDRHTFQLHMVEGPAAGVTWSPANWLQLEGNGEFLAI